MTYRKAGRRNPKTFQAEKMAGNCRANFVLMKEGPAEKKKSSIAMLKKRERSISLGHSKNTFENFDTKRFYWEKKGAGGKKVRLLPGQDTTSCRLTGDARRVRSSGS